jgi:hypothetical protein
MSKIFLIKEEILKKVIKFIIHQEIVKIFQAFEITLKIIFL